MKPTPLRHASAAALYIVLIVSALFSFADRPEADVTILMPITMLSLLVLSAATMGYLFFFEPVRLALVGKTEEGVRFFMRTLGIFALYAALALAAPFFISTI